MTSKFVKNLLELVAIQWSGYHSIRVFSCSSWSTVYKPPMAARHVSDRYIGPRCCANIMVESICGRVYLTATTVTNCIYDICHRCQVYCCHENRKCTLCINVFSQWHMGGLLFIVDLSVIIIFIVDLCVCVFLYVS